MTAAPQSGPPSAGGSSSRPGPASPLVVGLDIGTTSVKGVLVDEYGQVVERRRVPSQLVIGPGGQFEHDAAATWWDAPRRLLNELLGSPVAAAGPGAPGARAVAVSAMMPSVAAVNVAGGPLGPGLLYGDGRGAAQVDAGAAADAPPAAAAGAAAAAAAGSDPTASDEMARLAGWAAAHTPAASGYWPAQAVANAALSGEGVTDLASAFAAGSLFNGSGWDEAACAAAGLRPVHLPRVAMFGERIGQVSAGAVPGESYGEVVLGAGSVDGLCEQLVSGAVKEGDVLVALGSTLVVWLCTPGWPDEVPGLWRVPHIVGGMAMVGGASNAGGMWVDWADRALRPGGSQDVAPDAVPLWWPWARGERVPWHDPELRISLAGADLGQGAPALRRAALEASAFVARNIVERASATGTTPRRYIVSGGGTANAGWLHALADVLAQPVLPMAVPEGAAVGAAFLARMAAGLETSTDDALRWARWSPPVEPRTSWSQAAAERYRRWCQGLPASRP